MKPISMPLFLLLSILWTGTATAKDWHIDSVRVQAVISPDGILRIRETRHYRFEGSYSRAHLEIRKRGFEDLMVEGVSWDGQPLVLDDSKEAGTWYLQDRRKLYRIRWYYRAEDTTAEFVVTYSVVGAIVRGAEWSELYWTWLGSDWERHTENFRLDLRFESDPALGDAYAWAHGDREAVRTLAATTGALQVETGRVRRKEGLRVRFVFPSAWVPDYRLVEDAAFTLETAMDQERIRTQEIVAEAARDARFEAYFSDMAPALVVAPISIFLIFFRRYGSRFKPGMLIPPVRHTAPDDLPPAVVAYFTSMNTNLGGAMITTLLGFVRAGYLRIHMVEGRKDRQMAVERLKDIPEAGFVLAHEQVAARRFNELPLGEIRVWKTWMEDRKAKWHSWFPTFSSAIKSDINRFGLYDEESWKGVAWSAILTGFFILVGFGAAAYGGPWGIGALLSAVTCFIASFAIHRRTEAGETTYRNWVAYREGLKTGRTAELAYGKPTDHLMAALALGITSGKLTKLMEQVARPDDPEWTAMFGTGFDPVAMYRHVAVMVHGAGSTSGGVSGATAGSAGGGGGGGAG